MTDKKKISHDIMNTLERLRIMHDLIRDQNYDLVPKEELKIDLEEALRKLKENYALFLQ